MNGCANTESTIDYNLSCSYRDWDPVPQLLLCLHYDRYVLAEGCRSRIQAEGVLFQRDIFEHLTGSNKYLVYTFATVAG